MAHVCFYVCCSDCVGVCGNICCVAAILKYSGFLSLGVLKYVCVRGVMDVVFSVCIMLVYGKYECFVMQMLYVCVLCAFCGSSQCCILHDLQFVNADCSYCSPFSLVHLSLALMLHSRMASTGLLHKSNGITAVG